MGSGPAGPFVSLSRDPFLISTLHMLYCSLIRQKLEYCSNTCSPFYLSHAERLQSEHRRFLRLIVLQLGYRYLDSSISEIELQLDPDPLHLLSKSAHHKIQDLFVKRSHQKNYFQHAPIHILMKLGNAVTSSGTTAATVSRLKPRSSFRISAGTGSL
ncbi:hypothetical protein J6590_075445 [Homalodisca vitripennis]|nr:hypothetical protein J6590_075445 [Homalodisca vitripennis]